jgi:hypothetical protein
MRRVDPYERQFRKERRKRVAIIILVVFVVSVAVGALLVWNVLQ